MPREKGYSQSWPRGPMSPPPKFLTQVKKMRHWRSLPKTRSKQKTRDTMKLLNAWVLAWRKQTCTMIKHTDVIEAICLSKLWITTNGGEKKQIWKTSTGFIKDRISYSYHSIKIFLIAREKVTLLVYRPRNKNNKTQLVKPPVRSRS